MAQSVTIKELKADNWKWLKTYWSTGPGENFFTMITSDMAYIENLAMQSNTVIDDWDLQKVFSLDRYQVGNLAHINKCFFEYRAELEAVAAKSASFALDKKLVQELERMSKEHFKAALTSRTQQIASEQAAAAERYNNFLARMQNVAKLQDELNALEQRTDKLDLTAQVADIIRAGFWKPVKVRTATELLTWNNRNFNGYPGILFESVNPVFARLVDKNQNIDYTVNFGILRILCDPTNARVYAEPHPSNHNIAGYWQMFICSAGSICFGSGTDLANKHLRERNMPALMELLAAILTNPIGSPYRNITSFPRWTGEVPEGAATPREVLPQEQSGSATSVLDRILSNDLASIVTRVEQEYAGDEEEDVSGEDEADADEGTSERVESDESEQINFNSQPAQDVPAVFYSSEANAWIAHYENIFGNFNSGPTGAGRTYSFSPIEEVREQEREQSRGLSGNAPAWMRRAQETQNARNQNMRSMLREQGVIRDEWRD